MEEMKKCPYCGEEILAAAKKCKYCGEYLEENLRNDIFSKQEIGEFREKINSLRQRGLPKGLLEKKKEEVEKAIDRCEGIFESICNPGYRPLCMTLGVIMVLIFLFAVSCGFENGEVGGAIAGAGIGLLIDFCIWLYFLPSYIAFRNAHKQAWLILVINLFFSILVIPYLIILIWALSNKHNEDVLTLEQSNRIRAEVMPLYEETEQKIEQLWQDSGEKTNKK